VITEHAVCALPDDHRDWRHLVIKVQRRGTEDSWVLNHGNYHLVPDGEWSPNARYALRFDERLALEVAEHWAPRVEVNGRTAADLLARDRHA
jgi:hypothetical protein